MGLLQLIETIPLKKEKEGGLIGNNNGVILEPDENDHFTFLVAKGGR